MVPKFQSGDSVRIKSDPTDSWAVVERYAPRPEVLQALPNERLWLLCNIHGHERVVRESDIEHAPWK